MASRIADVCLAKVPTEPDDIAVLLTPVGGDYVRVSLLH